MSLQHKRMVASARNGCCDRVVSALVSADDVKRDVFVECLVALFQPLEIPATPADARWLYY
jgi:hypothetical protein